MMKITGLAQHNTYANCADSVLDLVLYSGSETIVVDRCAVAMISEDRYHPAVTVNLKRCTKISSGSVSIGGGARYDFKHADYIGLFSGIKCADWSGVMSSSTVDGAVREFYDVIDKIWRNYVPLINNKGPGVGKIHEIPNSWLSELANEKLREKKYVSRRWW